MTSMMLKVKTTCFGVLLLFALVQPARGEETWQQSFEQTCSKSSEAMTLSVDELRALLDNCSALQKVIEKQEDSLRKVYLKRLQLCRNLYAYVLEHKLSEASSK